MTAVLRTRWHWSVARCWRVVGHLPLSRCRPEANLRILTSRSLAVSTNALSTHCKSGLLQNSRTRERELLKVSSPRNFTALNNYCASGKYMATREEAVKQIWRNADAVCFDVDSTVCQDETVDELAAFLGVREEVAKCSEGAMNGRITIREAIARSLGLMHPSLKQLESFVSAHPPRLTPGISDLVAELHRRRVDVYLVSGGFRLVISHVADLLKIPRVNIYANDILFDSDGNFIGFDKTQPTSDSGSKEVGKPVVCALLKKRMGYKNLVMVGDGVTDMEASPPADAFIGFAGNKCREKVKCGAAWLVYDFDSLRKELP